MPKPVVDYFLGDLLLHQHQIDVLTDAPANPVTGQMYIDSATGVLYIYWGSWQSTGITLTPPAPSAGTRYASLWFLFGNVH